MEVRHLDFALAFVAGLLSFASPCVLPLVPAYLGYLSGTTVRGRSPRQGEVFLHALVFVLGFSLVFVLLWASVGLISHLLREWVGLLRRLGGLMVVAFGLHLMGLMRIPVLYREKRWGFRGRPGWGYLSSLLVGMAFAAGWTPCVGPILSAILALSLGADVVRGTWLLAGYSLGLGLPFLLAGLALSTVGGWLRRLNRYGNLVSLLSGLLLVVIGVFLFTGRMERLAAYGCFVPWFR